MEEENIIIESYPDEIQTRIEKRDRLKRQNVPSYINQNARELVFEDLKLWRVGTLKVSFKGGSTALHKNIAEVASIWSKYGNIKFDFGYNASTGNYRNWTPNDQSHIRVGFEYNGYWSLVGNDSADIEIVKPGEVTLNLSKFDMQIPNNWEGTVLHEFGHALGFHHEHQSPETMCDFDWPRLYDYLGGSPNFWPKWKVDHNLRQLQTGGHSFSAHDINSIMHYSFPSWMFHSKENSPCYTTENNSLSEQDKKMMARAYPFEISLIEAIDNTRIGNLNELMSLPNVSGEIQNLHSIHLEYYKNIQE